MSPATVTAIRAPDRTNAERQRRFRARHKLATVTAAHRNAPTGVEVCELAARLGAGIASAADLEQAEQLLLLLVCCLPPTA